jgi:FtsP/CotA-like multicopper oxidase with cupredoxin domain
VGDLIEFEVTNMTDAHHPFHQHGFSFQPLELCGPGGSFLYDYNEFVDNVDIPAGHTLVYRIRLSDRPMMDGSTPGGAIGRWVFHCHVFHHAAQGMISELVALPSE